MAVRQVEAVVLGDLRDPEPHGTQSAARIAHRTAHSRCKRPPRRLRAGYSCAKLGQLPRVFPSIDQLAAEGLTETARGKSRTPFIKAGPFRVSLPRKAPALLVAEGAVWPDEWLVPQDPRPDRSTALKAVKAGAAPDGFGLTEPTTRLAIK